MISTFFGKIGSGILTFIIGLLILRETDSAISFGISQLIGPVVSFVLLPITGSIVDRYDRKKILLIAQSISVIALVYFLGVIYLNRVDNLIFTYILLIFLKISDQFLLTTFSASFSTIVLEEHIQKVKSIQQVISAFSTLLIPMLAVLALDFLPLLHLVVIEIVIEIFAVIIIGQIDFTYFQETDKETAYSDDTIFVMFKEGLNFTKRHRKLVFALVFAMLLNFLFGAVNVGLPYLQVSLLELSDFVYGGTEAVFALGMVGTAVLLSSIKPLKYPLWSSWKMILLIGGLFIYLGVLLIYTTSQIILIVGIALFNFVIGASITTANIPVTTWIVMEVPKNYQGRVFNLLNTGSQILSPLGILFFSVLFEQIEFTPIIFIVSGLSVITFTIFYPLIIGLNLKNNSVSNDNKSLS